MKRAFIAVLLSLILPGAALASFSEPCPPPKVIHKAGFKCKKGLVKVKCNGQLRCLPPTAPCAQPVQPVPAPKIVVVEVPAPCPTLPAPERKAEPLPAQAPVTVLPDYPDVWHVGPYVQFGSGISEPRSKFDRRYSTLERGGLLEYDAGFHAHYLPLRLGARAYYAGSYGNGYGFGGQLQYYVWQGTGLEVHLDAGALYTGGPFNLISTSDVQRRWDFQYGLGLEYPLAPNWVLMADARASQPLGNQDSVWSKQGSDIALNALHQFHLLGGLMYRF